VKVNRRTDVEKESAFDIRFINEKLEGKYDNIYIILSTLEDEPTAAWEESGDNSLLINLPKEKILNASIDYKAEIMQHLPKLSWLESEVLLAYVQERWE